MTIEAELLKTLNQMPESLKQEVLHYAKYVAANYTPSEVEHSHTNQTKDKRGGFGALAGKIWMSEDFDEPLEDLEEYM